MGKTTFYKYILKILFQVVYFPFLSMYYEEQFFILIKSNLLLLLFFKDCSLGFVPKKSLPKRRYSMFLYVFLILVQVSQIIYISLVRCPAFPIKSYILHENFHTNKPQSGPNTVTDFLPSLSSTWQQRL